MRKHCYGRWQRIANAAPTFYVRVAMGMYYLQKLSLLFNKIIGKINGKYILYGLGNFCFGGNKNPKIKDTMIVQTIANFDANGLVGDLQLKIIPCSISSKNDSNDYCPTIAEGEKKEKIIQLVNKYSADFPVFVMDDGTVVHEQNIYFYQETI